VRTAGLALRDAEFLFDLNQIQSSHVETIVDLALAGPRT
jgi:hypothetical protein